MCGKVYFCAELHSGEYYTSSYIYTKEGMLEFLRSHQKEHTYRYVLDEKGEFRKNIFQSAEDFYDRFTGEQDSEIVDLLIKAGTPIIQIHGYRSRLDGRRVVLNPCLRMIEFYRCLDPYTAFQEISMFISGVMGGQAPPMIQVSDTVRLEKHGFDRVTSFRNMRRS